MIKIVQVGRVIIQDDVEIGANIADRLRNDDTVIGEGTKIDNQVQIGHNVRIGRHCASSARRDCGKARLSVMRVMIGGAAGVNGHIKIGDGVQIAAMSGGVGRSCRRTLWRQISRPMRDFLPTWQR